MPELPEVETIRIGLEKHIKGRQFVKVEVKHPRPVRFFQTEVTLVEKILSRRKVQDVKRRGKYLWFAFDDNDALVIHLGMSGQFRINQQNEELHKHTRVVFNLDNGKQLRFLDQRMFGGLQLVEKGSLLPVPHIALDPFDSMFNRNVVARQLSQKKTTIKRALLNQRLVSGIGNIYADETLWRMRIHYQQLIKNLSLNTLEETLKVAKDVMAESLRQGGTSFDSMYVNVNGESGYFSRSLNVYGRKGKPCPRCKTLIIRNEFMNRSSYLCPRCQGPLMKEGK